jgi:hypothetical protein
VLTRLEPVSSQLWELHRDGYWLNWRCTVGAHDLEHAAELDRDTLARIIALPGDLWIDTFSTPDADYFARWET